MIVQMQSSSTANFTFEYARILSTTATTLTFPSSIANSYYSGTFNSTSSEVAQVVRIPQYTNVTLPSGNSIIPTAWNGYSGGIVAFLASGTANIAGTVSASGMGFRGGAGVTFSSASGSDSYGNAGESWSGIGGSTNAQNNGGGGGGGMLANNSFVADGGGGGYSTGGTASATPYFGMISGAGGTSGWWSSLTQLFMGPGGGGGIEYNAYGSASSGKSGGGMVLVLANSLTVTGSIASNGTNANPGTGDVGGQGGAGAGGSVYLYGNTLSIGSNLVTATGGPAWGGSGFSTGAGGNGFIRIDYFSSLTGSSNPSPSYEGGL